MANLSRTRAAHGRLRVEQLEDRCTPSIAGAAYEAGRVLVGFADPSGGSALAGVAGSPLTTGVAHLGAGSYQVNLAAGVSVDAAVTTFTAVPGVRFAEPDYTVGASVIPNDASFGSLWGMHNTGQSGGTVDADIDAPEGWDSARGTGRTVVGVIDTGIDYRHPDLYLNVWINEAEIPTAIRTALTDTDADGRITFYDLNNAVNQGAGKITDLNANGRIDAGDLLANNSGWENGADNGGNGRIDDLIGWDFVNNDNDPLDDNNHGTHCAGTIGAIGNNGVGVAGVAWRTRIAGLKFLNASGSGSIANATAAVNYARLSGIPITSNSWGGGGFSQAMFDALVAARNAGGVFIAAAGNSNANNDATPNYPSNYAVDNVVAVAATDRFDQKSSFSSYGATTVDLGAPGSSILSTTPNGTYSTFSGTSMATPHVSGAFAVVWDANPGLSYSQAISRILTTVRPTAAMAGRTVTGGVLNLQAALGTSPPPPGDTSGARVTTAAFNGTAGVNFTGARFTFNEAVNPSSFTTADVAVTGPAGGIAATAVTPVAGSGNTQFDVTFATQTAAGAYSVRVGPDVLDLAGNPMNQDGDAVNGEVPADQYTLTGAISGRANFTTTGAFPIRDFQTTIVNIPVSATQPVLDLDVTLNLTHTWDSDLFITLRSPAGTTITLSNRRGGSGDNFTNTVFDDEAAAAIAQGTAPFNGRFRPDGLLSTYDNLAANGTWQLRVADRAAADVGSVSSVTLSFLLGGGGSGFSIFGFADDAPVSAPVTGGPTVTAGPPAVRVGWDFALPAVELPPLVEDDGEVVALTVAELPAEEGIDAPAAVGRVAADLFRLPQRLDDPADDFAPIEV